MKRVLRSLGQMRVENVVFFQSFLCEKSYSQSSLYSEESVYSYLQEGFEQIDIEQNVRIQFFKKFKPFLEDYLLNEFGAPNVLITDPDGKAARSSRPSLPQAIVFGPERGFSQKEIELMNKRGFSMESFGSDHLRLETAIPFILGNIRNSALQD